MSKLPLHPLMRENANTHYNTEANGDNSIVQLEQDMTVNDCIGACRWNMYKYASRKKNQDEADTQKIIDYGRYKDELINLQIKGCGSMKVEDAWVWAGKKWRYQ